MKIIIYNQFFKSLDKCFRSKYHPKEIWYRLKCRWWKRYDVVKPRYLSSTWQDRCVLLPYVAFEVLSQFLEQECSPGDVEWYGDYSHTIKVDGQDKNVMDEMKDLYEWWHQDYNKKRYEREQELCISIENIEEKYKVSDFKEIEGESDLVEWKPTYNNIEAEKQISTLCCKLTQLETEYDKELNHRLHRLIEVVPFMWT